MFGGRCFKQRQPEGVPSRVSGPFAESRYIELTQPISQALTGGLTDIDSRIAISVSIWFVFAARDEIHPGQVFTRQFATVGTTGATLKNLLRLTYVFIVLVEVKGADPISRNGYEPSFLAGGRFAGDSLGMHLSGSLR